MPLTIETSPALVTSTNTSPATTASFTPGAGNLLVATVVAASAAAPVVSGGGLTWTRQVQSTSGGCEIWTAVGAGAAMTVAVAVTETGGGFGAGLKVDVVSGIYAVNPIGLTGTGSDPTDVATVTGYTSTGESRGFCAARDTNDGGAPLSTDVASSFHLSLSGPPFNLKVSGMSVHKAADTAGPGVPVTFNLDSFGTSDALWQWAALEILAPPLPVRPAVVIPVGASRRASSW